MATRPLVHCDDNGVVTGDARNRVAVGFGYRHLLAAADTDYAGHPTVGVDYLDIVCPSPDIV
jgi:hypothetical protein